MATPTSEASTATAETAATFSQRRRYAADQAISYLMQQGVENRNVLSLAAGLVDYDTLPVEATRRAFEKLFARSELARAALQYGTTHGAERLRVQLLRHLARLEKCTPDQLGLRPDQILLTTGSQQLLALVTDALLDPGDICLVAAPTYFVFLGTLAGAGARAVPVAADEHGMRTDALERRLSELEQTGQLPRVKLVYVVSYYENPTGVSLSVERRRQLVEIVQRWSRQHRIFVLEDAAYRELRYDGPELPSVWHMDGSREHVILAHTFSKSFSPGVRVGFGVLPSDVFEAVCDLKGNEDFGSASLNQHLMATVLEEGLYEPHVRLLRDSYRRKRDAMLAAAQRFFGELPGVSWYRPHGGLYVWMTLPKQVQTGFDSELFRRAVREGVLYVPGELCFPAGDAGVERNHLRLSFGVQSPEGIELGMERLARALRAVLAEQ